ncbi:hypothetical protein PtA15_15A406 [Puccinia triticina]|uniref:Uncharacterized protein n=1 Tax=Puccinia triticina TaxID=208348 RepID=A0ABY7D6V9_9BASI|nr:uncharacterized protein PtA15_15A406 [Puccinia triticina]WAQ92012.1 hypothetical protein PtA15_15A406 [Puccinia triticina]
MYLLALTTQDILYKELASSSTSREYPSDPQASMDRPLSSNNVREDDPDEIQTLGPTTPSSTERDMDTPAAGLPLATRSAADLEAQQTPAASLPDPSSYPGRPAGLHPLAIPPLSLGQKLYIILPQMIGAAILDGAANFGIGCAMYLNAKNVRIWILKNNTVAGDMAVTIFIQGVLTFCIASGMVHVDLRKNKISAFQYPWPDTSWGAAKRLPPDEAQTRIGRLWRQFHNGQGFSRGLHFFSGSDVNDIFDSRLSRSQFTTRLCWSIWKGSVLSLIFFFLIWPISIAIVTHAQGPRGPGHAGLGWRSADVHRRRSLDTARRTSRGRYANPSGDLNRSTSVGSARAKPQADTFGLFGPSGQLTAPHDTNHRYSSHSNISGRMRTLSEHSAQH